MGYLFRPKLKSGGSVLMVAALHAWLGWSGRASGPATLSSFGLVLDILGASVLVWSPLRKYLAAMRVSYKGLRAERLLPPWWIATRWLYEAARIIGSRDVRVTSPSMDEEAEDNATGLLLLLLGFGAQLVSVWWTAAGR